MGLDLGTGAVVCWALVSGLDLVLGAMVLVNEDAEPVLADCEELDGIFDDIGAFLDGRGVESSEILDTYLPKLEALMPVPWRCFPNHKAFSLFTLAISCTTEDAETSCTKITCFKDEEVMFLLLGNLEDLLVMDWNTLALHRDTEVLYRLMSACHYHWPGRSLPPGCGDAEVAFYMYLHRQGGDYSMCKDGAFEYVQGTFAEDPMGGRLESHAAGRGDDGDPNECKTQAIATAWIIIGLSTAGKQAQSYPLTPSSALYLTQRTLREYYGLLLTHPLPVNTIMDSLRVPLLDSAWPIFSGLYRLISLCAEASHVGRVTDLSSRGTSNPTGLEAAGGNESAAVAEANMGRLPYPFTPDFTAAMRERFILTHHAFHRFCAAVSIPYTLVRGPLLGAARHHAPLPWENDGDVCVPRERFDEFVAIALAQSSAGISERCLALPRCRHLAREARNILQQHARVLVAQDKKSGLSKALFYLSDDAQALLSGRRGLHDPVIDIYFCRGWPAEGGPSDEFIEGDTHANPRFPKAWIFPLRRVFFGGLSLWAYRDPLRVMSERYGPSWQDRCRSPDQTVVGKAGRDPQRPWPHAIPCSALHGFYSFASPRAVLGVDGLPWRLRAWLCAAFIRPSCTSQASAGWRASLPCSACSEDGAEGGQCIADTLTGHITVQVDHVDELRSPRHASAPLAHATLHYLLDVALGLPTAGVECDAIVRVVPTSATAPSAPGTNFDTLWFALPSVAYRALVKLTDPPGEAFLHVFACVCRRHGDLLESPFWDLEYAPEDVLALAAAALRSSFSSGMDGFSPECWSQSHIAGG